jgi:hypothetical protein
MILEAVLVYRHAAMLDRRMTPASVSSAREFPLAPPTVLTRMPSFAALNGRGFLLNESDCFERPLRAIRLGREEIRQAFRQSGE